MHPYTQTILPGVLYVRLTSHDSRVTITFHKSASGVMCPSHTSRAPPSRTTFSHDPAGPVICTVNTSPLCVRMATGDPNVQRFTDGKTIRKTIYVPKKLVNIVVS